MCQSLLVIFYSSKVIVRLASPYLVGRLTTMKNLIDAQELEGNIHLVRSEYSPRITTH